MHAASLRYFEAVARAGSVRQASERLNVAASAIDRQILRLEEELGVQLYERLPRGMRLTSAGELLLRHVRQTLHEFDRLKGEIDQIKGIRTGTVRIACLDSLMVHFVPDAISTFHKTHPAVSMNVSSGTHGFVAQRIADGAADIGITFNLPAAPDHLYLDDVPMPIMAMVARRHPLARRKDIGIDDCMPYPLLLQEDTQPIRSLIDIELNILQKLKTPLVVSNSMLALKPLIREGIGIAFYTPIGFLDELASGEIVALPLAVEPFQELRLGLMFHRRRKPTPAAAAVVELMRVRLKALAAEVGRLTGSHKPRVRRR